MSDRSRFNAPNNQEAIVDKDGRPTNFMVKFFNESYRYINTIIEGVVDSVNGRTGDVTLTKADVGLGNVDNTKDQDKPVSQPQAAALDDKENKGVAQTLMNNHEAAFDPHPQYSFAKGGVFYWFTSGRYYNGMAVEANFVNDTFNFDEIRLYPFLVNRVQSFSDIAIYLNNTPSSTTVFFTIYKNKSDSEIYPGQLHAVIEHSFVYSAAIEEVSLDGKALNLEPGIYWIGFCAANPGIGTTWSLKSFTANNSTPMVLGYTNGGTSFNARNQIRYSFGTTPTEMWETFPPDTDPAVSYLFTNSGWLFLKAIDNV